MAKTKSDILKKNKGMFFKTIDGGVAVLNRDKTAIYILNATAYELWQNANGKTALNQIIEKIAGKYKKEMSVVRKDIEHFLKTLPNDLPLFV